MATKFYNVEKAAEILGVPVAEVNQLRESHQLRGLRDGSDWKFKAEEVESLALKMKGTGSGIGSNDLDFDVDDGDDADILLSEVELGSSDPSASGTVIGPPPEGDEIQLDSSEEDDPIGSAVTNFEDLDLTIEDSALDFASSGIGLDSDINADILADDSGPKGHEPTGASSILGLADEDLDDDDLVLGGESGVGSGSGSGSDITLGGDSGISLIDPADSGISLEEPLDLSADGEGSGGEGSFTLAGDSILSLADNESLAESSSDLSSDGDDFMLSSMDEEEEEDSSQVIALEEAGSDSGIGESLLDLDDSPSDAGVLDSQIGFGSQIGLGSQVGFGSQINLDTGDDDEVVDLSEGIETGSSIGSLGSGIIDFGEVSDDSFASIEGLEGQPVAQAASANQFGAAAPAAAGQAVAASSELNYTKVDYLFLYCSLFTLGFVGVVLYDLIRNMASWSQASSINCWLIDMFKSMLG